MPLLLAIEFMVVLYCSYNGFGLFLEAVLANKKSKDYNMAISGNVGSGGDSVEINITGRFDFNAHHDFRNIYRN